MTRKDGGLRLQALKYSMRWSSSASWAMALYLCPRAAMGAEKPSAALSRLTETCARNRQRQRMHRLHTWQCHDGLHQ